MVWKTKLPPAGSRPRRRVRDLAKDLDVPVEQILAILHELGEFVSSPLSPVEEPVVAKVHEHCGRSYVAQSVEPAPGPGRDMGTIDSSCQINPPAPHPPQGYPSHELRRHTAAAEGDRWAVGLGKDALNAFAYESWKLFGFSETERDVWIDAGLRAGQAKTAAALRDAELRPSDLQRDVSGWTVLDRVTKGEGAQGVARLLKAAS